MNNDLLVPSRYLSDQYHCNLFLKPEWYGPTKSHKDKWAKEAIKLAKENGAKRVVVMSAGNQGLAVAYASKMADIECMICLKPNYNPVYLELFKKYGAGFDIAAEEADQYTAFDNYVTQGYFPLGVTHAQRDGGRDLPAIDAYRLTATEIIDTLKSRPDIIIFPASYADHSEGALREFIDLKSTGKIDEVPQIILARADQLTGAEATSIATDVTTRYIEDVIDRSNGESFFITSDEMKEAKAEIKLHHGWDIELSAAASVACLDKLSRDALSSKTVVVILTALENK